MILIGKRRKKLKGSKQERDERQTPITLNKRTRTAVTPTTESSQSMSTLPARNSILKEKPTKVPLRSVISGILSQSSERMTSSLSESHKSIVQSVNQTIETISKSIEQSNLDIDKVTIQSSTDQSKSPKQTVLVVDSVTGQINAQLMTDSQIESLIPICVQSDEQPNDTSLTVSRNNQTFSRTEAAKLIGSSCNSMPNYKSFRKSDEPPPPPPFYITKEMMVVFEPTPIMSDDRLLSVTDVTRHVGRDLLDEQVKQSKSVVATKRKTRG